ncbi:CHT2 Chitinase 2 [Candida maltosa Xu316]
MLSFKTLLATALTASVAASSQIALYWGQNGAGGQEPLATYCANNDVDIILLSFLNFFPDPVNLNFANQCGNTFDSGLLHCSQIGEDIKTCQSQGKKVLLSLGGGIGDYGFENSSTASAFATTLWNKFGAGTGDDERPFDDAIVDGFDFDIEEGTPTGYPELATSLRSLYASDSSKQYYLSAAPQCPYPDTLLNDLLTEVPLDFAFIQFYNNYCSIDQSFNYDTWADFAASSPNKDIQLFVGVPATNNIPGYVDSEQLAEAIDQVKCNPNFGGVSIWDASGAWLNVDSAGDNYVVQVKNVLDQAASGEAVCESSASSSATSEDPASSTESVTESSSSSSAAHHYTNSTTTTGSSIQSGTSISSTTKSKSAKPTAPVTTSGPIHQGSGKDQNKVTDISKTVVTITSCSENKCVPTPVTTGYVVVTDIDTIYTTYCPLTNSKVFVPVKTQTVSAGTVTKTVACTSGVCTGTAVPSKGSESESEVVESVATESVSETVASESVAKSVATESGVTETVASETAATESVPASETEETTTVETFITLAVSSPSFSASTFTTIASAGANNNTVETVQVIPSSGAASSTSTSRTIIYAVAALVGATLFM